jgi:glycerol-3-phosphate cytidylyltransferase-like family protein
MSKNVLIAGGFDCFNTRHLHIIKEAKKLAIPNGRVVVLLFADYTQFVLQKTFPIQSVNNRRRNLEYFIKPEDIIVVDTSDYEHFLDVALADLHDFIYMHYETDKEFSGRFAFKKNSVPVKFIKEPKI